MSLGENETTNVSSVSLGFSRLFRTLVKALIFSQE